MVIQSNVYRITLIYIPDVESRASIAGLKELAISTGSACTTANTTEPSHVITALGFGENRAHSSLRWGVVRNNDRKQIEFAIEIPVRQIIKLKTLAL